MNKGVAAVLILIFLIPLAHTISIKDLVKKYSFEATTTDFNLTNYADYMIDTDNNGINDTLVFELAADSVGGNFIFVIDLFDGSGVLTGEAKKEMVSGTGRLNITFSSFLLSQSQFNYSIKAYNSTYSLKYRKDNILTQNYPNYEEGFKVLEVKDSREGKALRINITLDSSVEGAFETALFLSYNNTAIFSKENKSLVSSRQYLIFNFDNETIKRTHYAGNFKINSLKIGKKLFRIGSATAFYDFRDFAASSYISGFSDNAVDTDGDNKYNLLRISADAEADEENVYTIVLAVYDQFGSLIEIKNVSQSLNAGGNRVDFDINGTRIRNKKLSGPFIVKYAELYKNGVLADKISNAYTTDYYSFGDFDAAGLPDLAVAMADSGQYHYGLNNTTMNITLHNTGDKPAFGVIVEIFDNGTLSKSYKANILDAGSKAVYQIWLGNISDFEVSAVADLQDSIEELDESNNAEKYVIRLNRQPHLEPVNNLTANEPGRIIINLSASDPNGDNLVFSINSSRFSNNSNIFIWNTTKDDGGNHTLVASVSDGYLNDSAAFNIEILNTPENDMDKDGIDDTIDRLIGNASSVNTSIIQLKIVVGSSTNLSESFNKSLNVKFLDNKLAILEFPFDFSRYRLNLTNITINKQLPNQKGALAVSGLKIPRGTKTMYVDRAYPSSNWVCVKDAEISSINEISKKCNAKNEVRVWCLLKLNKSYTCTYNRATKKYKVQGLKNSGVVQFV